MEGANAPACPLATAWAQRDGIWLRVTGPKQVSIALSQQLDGNFAQPVGVSDERAMPFDHACRDHSRGEGHFRRGTPSRGAPLRRRPTPRTFRPAQSAPRTHRMISVEAARERILADLHPTPAEVVALAEAWGRVTAAPVLARLTQPPADVSAMDGYALRAPDGILG